MNIHEGMGKQSFYFVFFLTIGCEYFRFKKKQQLQLTLCFTRQSYINPLLDSNTIFAPL